MGIAQGSIDYSKFQIEECFGLVKLMASRSNGPMIYKFNTSITLTKAEIIEHFKTGRRFTKA